MKRSNIDGFIKSQEGVSRITVETINDIQLRKLNAVLKKEKERDGFYNNLPGSISSLEELSDLPFTTQEELSLYGGRMLICSQGDVKKVISERTSGTTGAGKRVFYTEKDCENTIRLFMAGLGEFIYKGSVTMIAMPFSGPYGLGELIYEAVERLGARPLATGTGKRYGELKEIIERERADTYVGMPVSLLSMLRMCGRGSLKRALVSGDACPQRVIEEIENILETRLWPHYGSREMGLGGAICCKAHEGMHMRENHFIAEIVDGDGKVLKDGEWGELVITTIGMEAQPLIRYRTGDITRIIPGRCRCGSVVRRLDTVQRMEIQGITGMARNSLTDIPGLDELLFEIPELVDYKIEEEKGGGYKITALFLNEDGEELLKKKLLKEILTENMPLLFWTCKKAGYGDRPLYMGKRVLLSAGAAFHN